MRAETRSDALADRLRHVRHFARARIVKDSFPTGLPKGSSMHWSSTPAVRSLPISGCARRSRCCSTSNGSTRISSSVCYQRTGSYFEGSDLSVNRPSRRRDASASWLAAFPGAVRDDVMEGKGPPTTDGSGRDRDMLKKALALVRGGRLRTRRAVLRDRGPADSLDLRNSRHLPRPGAAWHSLSRAT